MRCNTLQHTATHCNTLLLDALQWGNGMQDSLCYVQTAHKARFECSNRTNFLSWGRTDLSWGSCIQKSYSHTPTVRLDLGTNPLGHKSVRDQKIEDSF